MTTRLTGYEAIEFAAERGTRLHRYADPIEGARELTVDEAYDVAREDPSLVWTDGVMTPVDCDVLSVARSIAFT